MSSTTETHIVIIQSKLEHVVHVLRQAGEHGVVHPVVAEMGYNNGPHGWGCKYLVPRHRSLAGEKKEK